MRSSMRPRLIAIRATSEFAQKRTAGPSHGSCNELTARAVDASAQCYERLLPQFCALPVDDWGILASSFGQWDEEEPEVGIPQRALAKLVLSCASCSH